LRPPSEVDCHRSEPSSRPARSLGPRFPALANPRGVRFRFRAFVRKCGSEGIGCFAPGSRFPSALACLWVRLPVFPHSPYRPARPERRSLLRLRPPSGLSPEGSAGHLSVPAPLLDLSCRSAHPFRGSPLFPEVPSPVRSTFRVSHPLRGLLLPRPRGFVSPRKRPSASPFREFPSRGAATALRCRHAVLPFVRGCAPAS